MDSGPQENWTGPVRRVRKRGYAAQQEGSSCLSQPRARVLRGQRPEAMEEGETSPAESDSSDQGEAVTPFTQPVWTGGGHTLLFYTKRYKDRMGGHCCSAPGPAADVVTEQIDDCVKRMGCVLCVQTTTTRGFKCSKQHTQKNNIQTSKIERDELHTYTYKTHAES